MVSIVFADMDGTFLATDKSVPPENLLALDELARRGIPFVPCTGRPVIGIPEVLMTHAATRYAIGSNGAVVYDVCERENLHVERMDKARVLALYERLRGMQATFDVFADGEVFSERARYDAMGSLGLDEPTLAVLRRVRKPVDLLVPQILERAQAVEKITCFWKSTQDSAAIAQALAEVGGFSIAHGHPQNFELQAEGVSKGSALTWLCEHARIPVAEALSFGDEANDVPLLHAAGTGVAMANATPEVLAAAQAVTATNDQAGVARYLKRVLRTSR